MRVITYIMLTVLCLLTACHPDRTIEPIPEGQGVITLTLETQSQLKTRTVLSGSENLQHASSVFLYLFDATDKCIGNRQIPWPSPDDANVNYHTIKRNYSITLPPGNYTFLAIGLDDTSGDTYNLPQAIQEGTRLNDAIVSLATGKKKEDMAYSELFSGYTTVTVTEGVKTNALIELWRRVGGVMGWFSGIPAQIDGNALSRIQICLYAPQNKSAFLIPQPEGGHFPFGITNPANFNDYITDTTGYPGEGRILVSIDLPMDLTDSTILSGGAYILPVAAPAVGNGNEYTLRVELVSENNTILKTTRVQMNEGDDLYISPTGSGTGIIDTGGPFRFPIVANRFYGIGSAKTPINLGGNQNDIVITIDPGWEGQAPDVNLE